MDAIVYHRAKHPEQSVLSSVSSLFSRNRYKRSALFSDRNKERKTRHRFVTCTHTNDSTENFFSLNAENKTHRIRIISDVSSNRCDAIRVNDRNHCVSNEIIVEIRRRTGDTEERNDGKKKPFSMKILANSLPNDRVERPSVNVCLSRLSTVRTDKLSIDSSTLERSVSTVPFVRRVHRHRSSSSANEMFRILRLDHRRSVTLIDLIGSVSIISKENID